MRWELLPWQHGEEGNKGGDGQGKGHRVGRGRMCGMGRGRMCGIGRRGMPKEAPGRPQGCTGTLGVEGTTPLQGLTMLP